MNASGEDEGDREPGSDSSQDDLTSGTEFNSSTSSEEIPTWLRRTLLVSFMLSAVLLIIAYLYPQIRSFNDDPPSRLPDWKDRANEMIDYALSGGYERVPDLLEGLKSRHPKIRQNAEWGLYYVTGLPWAEKTKQCLKWWKKYGSMVKNGKDPPKPPPGHDTFTRSVPPQQANLDVFFNLISSNRVVLKREGVLAHYEVGIVNKNNQTPIKIYPPEKLPYRAYRYRPKIPESITKKYKVPDTMGRVPVHYQHGPSVALVLAKWYDPGQSLTRPVRNEFLEYTVLGRGKQFLKAGRIKGTRNRFPIRWDRDLMSMKGPHVVVRLTLDGRDLLIGYGKKNEKKIRISFRDITHVLKLFRQNPDQVPGYSKRRLTSLKSSADGRGYTLHRAERMLVGVPDGKTSSDPGTGTGGKPGASPSNPRAFAAYPKDLGEGTLIYDPVYGWGTIQSPCKPCKKAYKEKQLLSRIDIPRTTEEGEGSEQTPAQTSLNRRWILVFHKKD